jgi:peptide deformylase
MAGLKLCAIVALKNWDTNKMTILSILTVPNMALKQVSEPVDTMFFNEWLDQLVEDMISTASSEDLVGLAAPQVGVNQRIFIVDMNSMDLSSDSKIEKKPKNFKTFVNPEITHNSAEKSYGWEGCASVPGLIGLVKRSLSVKIKYQDVDGEFCEEEFYGWIARIIAHELDHLNGELFIKKSREVRKIMEE